MKNLTLTLLLMLFVSITYAQNAQDKEGVARACQDYLDGFYKGDTTKIINSIKPSLNKLGYWKNKETGAYESDGYMTFDQAKNYSKHVFETKRFPKEGAPQKVEVLDIMNTIASAKVTAWWGTDYILLSKNNGKWMIEQVLWEGPLQE